MAPLDCRLEALGCYDRQELDAALLWLRRALAAEPGWSLGFNRLGRICLLATDYGAAATRFARVLAVDRADRDAASLLVSCRAQLGDGRGFLQAVRLASEAFRRSGGLRDGEADALGLLIGRYERWSAPLSAAPALRFFDDDDEPVDERLLRKALLALAGGAPERAIGFIGLLERMSAGGSLRRVQAGDVVRLKSEMLAGLGIDAARLAAEYRDRYLVVRSHSTGFFADVLHSLTQLVTANVIGRVPLIHWGPESGYWKECENVWTELFEPVSAVRLDDLRQAQSFFPGSFNAANLHLSNNAAWFRNKEGASFLDIAGRHEQIAVVEKYADILDVLTLLPAEHPFRQVSPLELLKTFWKWHVRVRQDIATHAADWLRRHSGSRPLIAVHYRLQSSDKIGDAVESDAIPIGRYIEAIEAALSVLPAAAILVLTDFEPAISLLSKRYGDRILCRDVARLSVDTARRRQLGLEKTRGNFHLALEVLEDAVVAAGADYLILDGASNVSIAVYWMSGVPSERIAWLRAPKIGHAWQLDEKVVPRLDEARHEFVFDRLGA